MSRENDDNKPRKKESINSAESGTKGRSTLSPATPKSNKKEADDEDEPKGTKKNKKQTKGSKDTDEKKNDNPDYVMPVLKKRKSKDKARVGSKETDNELSNEKIKDKKANSKEKTGSKESDEVKVKKKGSRKNTGKRTASKPKSRRRSADKDDDDGFEPAEGLAKNDKKAKDDDDMLLKYTLDPTLKRTKLGEKDTKAGLLETFILRNEDWPIVLQFLVNEFGTQEPINHAFSLNPTDLIAGFQDQIINKWSSSEASIVVLRDNQLAAVIINWIVNIDQQKEYQPAVIRQDYSEIIKALRLEVDDYTTNFPIVGAVIDDLEQAVPYYIPDSDKFMRIDIVNVVKEFQGLGLARYLWSLALKMAKDLEVSYVESICTAVATQKIARSAGFTPVFALPYGELKENGNNLLPRTLVDGSDSAHIMVKNLNQSENIRPS